MLQSPRAQNDRERELRNDNARVIEAVAAGESFVATRNGVPVAELRPIRQTRRTFTGGRTCPRHEGTDDRPGTVSCGS